jgi:hypothetical protein
MTSESDNKAGRRPPTIELTATEVGNSQSPESAGAPPAAEPAAAAQDTRSEEHTRNENGMRGESESSRDSATESHAAESGAPEPNSSGPNAAEPRPEARSGRQLTSHAVSALLGAIAAAAIIGGAWLAGFVPSRNAASLAEPVATPSPATPSAADAEVTARLDKIERTIQAQQQPDTATGNRIAAVEAQTKSLGAGIATLGGRLDEIASASQSAVKQADAAHAAAEAATSASQVTNQAMNQNTAQRGDIAALTNRVGTLENAVKALTAAAAESAPEIDDRRARLSVAAEALHATVERGAPYQAELAAVQALGVDHSATAVLQPFASQGVPSLSALSRELTDLTPALENAVEPAAATDATFLDRLKANAQKLVRVTPAGAPPGNDPANVIARIKFDTAHGDIDAALADIRQLPDPAKALAADWIKKAQSRNAAIAASRQIATEALAALSKPSDQ